MSVAAGYYRHKIPSVDPEMRQAVADVIENPEAYFKQCRAQREREAEAHLHGILSRPWARWGRKQR